MRNLIPIGLIALAGCTPASGLDYGPIPTKLSYTSPEMSGLVAVRPFPNENSICQVIGENALTSELLDHTSGLIACPKHERGAIADRIAQGGQVTAHAKHWTILVVPRL